MRARDIVRKVVVVLLALLAAEVAQAQAQAQGPAVNVSAVSRGGVVVISYDLISASPTAQFSVVLEASADGGKTYALHPRTVKGDVGPAVTAGNGKQITWEAAQDVEKLEVDRYRYRVVAQPLTAQGPVTKPSQPTQPPVATSAAAGSGGKWGGIALLGGGAALAVLGATAMKEEVCDQHGNCSKEGNKAMMWAGVAAAAGGVVVLSLSRRHADVGTQVAIGPRGIMVQHTRTIPWITRSNRP
jgi:hypothetical protein